MTTGQSIQQQLAPHLQKDSLALFEAYAGDFNSWYQRPRAGHQKGLSQGGWYLRLLDRINPLDRFGGFLVPLDDDVDR
jgi:hypothetical protein